MSLRPPTLHWLIRRGDSGEFLVSYAEGQSTARYWHADIQRARCFSSEAKAIEVIRSEFGSSNPFRCEAFCYEWQATRSEHERLISEYQAILARGEPLGEAHEWLCHAGDASQCPDGCDAIALPDRLAAFEAAVPLGAELEAEVSALVEDIVAGRLELGRVEIRWATGHEPHAKDRGELN